MIIGTALGFGDLQTIALPVVLAFVFGYDPTSLPLLAAGLPLAAGGGPHGGPSPRVVGAIAIVAFVLGSAVLLSELAAG